MLVQADALRFKLLAIVGKNDAKKKSIIKALKKAGWTLVDVEAELLDIRKELERNKQEADIELGVRIKDWFQSKPNNIILTNASILYHDLFTKISPVGAFKYNSRNKNCVLFLEDEKKLGSRLYYSELGKADYYDQEINDIVMVNIDDINEMNVLMVAERQTEFSGTPKKGQGIGALFRFHQIKDVVDIDSDLVEDDKRKELIGSYIISESLERQIADFFDDLEKPVHKARTVIGNYGSGKSHLVGFLVSLVEKPQLAEVVSNKNIQQKVKQLNRKFYTVQFELGAAQVPLKRWFYGKVRKQLSEKYGIAIPVFDEQKDFDDKDNIIRIIETVKQKEPSAGLLVVIDEISDFLATKQKQDMKADLQFLRVIGQVCQDQDFMFVGSMQEDVFTSLKFKDVAAEIGRVGERFQNIIIHKEDVKKVISERIVPKSNEQKHTLEDKFKPFAEKIDDVGRNIDDYVDLFPLTPFLIELFSDLPYFEKRGVIQFAMSEIKNILNQPFPRFITFDRIYDLLENNPNKRNLEEIYELSKAMDVLKQKISLLESKYKGDALKIVKGLAVYSLWNKRERGATAQEMANHLMLLPKNKNFSAADNIALIVKKIREVTEGEYIKIQKDRNSGVEYFRFDAKTGVDPEQKIEQKAAAVSDDELEYELFVQLKDMLELDYFNGSPDVFEDECLWKSVKSFRPGYVLFARKGYKHSALPPRDYAVVFVSPFVQNFKAEPAKNNLVIQLHLEGVENIELLKEIVAIKQLINSGFQKQVMAKKLEKRINGDTSVNPPQTGFKYRLSKLLLNYAECTMNQKLYHIKKVIGRDKGSIPEIVEELKPALLDHMFNEQYPLHPNYPIQLSARNIEQSLSSIAGDLVRGDFTALGRNTQLFLQSLDLLDAQNYPDLSHSKIALAILDILKKKPKQVTDIEKDIVRPLRQSHYGLEAEVVYLILVVMTVLGKIYLQAKGGDRIDINNIREKVRSLAAFETIAYARLQENYSYDFAARLLNALGLTGNKITLEKERLTAFREYKERVNQILQDVQALEQTVESLSRRQQIFLDMQAVRGAFNAVKELEWEKLNIANHQQFGNIEFFSDKLPKLTIALNDMANLSEALQEYESLIHEAILYMDDALQLLKENALLVTDEQKLKALADFRDEVKRICGDFSAFTGRAQRHPIRGKIQQFKKSYIYDFYLPAHEKYVGKKVNWDALNDIRQGELFKKITLLNQLACISSARFEQMVLDWNDLRQYQCTNHNLEDNLQNTVRCPRCSFPSQSGKYAAISETLNRIEDDLEELYNSYEKIIINEIRAYRDNIRYLDSEHEKHLIETILNEQKLPELLTMQMVQTVNKLFKEIDVVEVDRETLIGRLFPNQEMTTIEDLRKNFFAMIEELKKNKEENSIRIKLK